MEREKNRRQVFFYYMLHTVLFVAAVVLCFAPILGLTAVAGQHVFVMLMVFTVLGGVKYLQGKLRLYAGLILGFCLLGVFLLSGMEECLTFLKEYAGWLFGLGSYSVEMVPFFEMMQIVWVSVLGFGLQFFMDKYPLLKRLSATVMSGWLIYRMFTVRVVHHMGVVCVIAYLVVVFVEWVQSRWKKESRSSLQVYMLWITPFLALYLILMSVMPAPETPYQWQWVNRIYTMLAEKFTIYTESILNGGLENFGMYTTGFSEDGFLLDGLVKRDTHVMTLECKSGLLHNIYLTGRIFDSFNGQEWKVTSAEQQNAVAEEDSGQQDSVVTGGSAYQTSSAEAGQDFLFDTLELVYAAERYAPDRTSDYIRSTGMHVRLEHFHTSCMFTPIKSWNVESTEKAIPYENVGSNLVFAEQQSYGTEYKLNFYQMNTAHPTFSAFVESKMPENEAVWNSIVREFGLDREIYSLEALYQYREKIAEQYGQQVEVSDEVREWLDEVTEGASTDLEKLTCIEEALHAYTYTLSPGKLPEDIRSEKEFLDYFLFESRQGYCAYFATAFTLLARAEGIPARYVQGFCVPVSDRTGIIVSSDMGHAWSEAYIEDIGFVPFEPTPGYEEKRELFWNVYEETIQDASVMEEEEDWTEEEAVSEDIEDVSEAVADTGNDGRLLLVAGIILLIIVSGVMVMLTADYFWERHREQKRSRTEQFCVEVLRNFQVLAALGYARREEETFTELRQRIEDVFAEEGSPLGFTELYEQVLYGNGEPDEGMLQQVKKDKEQLLVVLKKRKKKAYTIYRIRLYLIRYR